MAAIPLTEEEKTLSYSKYYYMPLDFPTEEEEAELKIPMDLKDAIPAEQLLKGLSTDFNSSSKNKYCEMPDGSIYAEVTMELTDCTDEMLGWWFPWFLHGPASIKDTNGNLRYRLWDPLDHWDTYGDVMVESFDDGAGGPKYYTNHQSQKPEQYGVPEEIVKDFREKGIIFSTLVNSSEGMCDRIVMNMYVPRPEGGFTANTKYWFGWTIKDGKPVRDLKETQFSTELARSIHRHNIIEKLRLNKMLPLLYKEQGSKPINED
ncbi:MAG: hypothetical protein HUJ76_03315 [Parasporobacterium sp.]|nr:hypothetical protein [Parasporobacterium sp.]